MNVLWVLFILEDTVKGVKSALKRDKIDNSIAFIVISGVWFVEAKLNIIFIKNIAYLSEYFLGFSPFDEQ